VKEIPSLLWFALALLLILTFRAQWATLLPGLRSLKLPGGIEVLFDAALKTAAETKGQALTVPERSRLVERAAREADLLRGSVVLWVDDDHRRTVNERAALTSLGTEVVMATSTDEALQLLAGHQFDLAISDIARGADEVAGITFLREARRHYPRLPIILYVGRLRPDLPLPVGAFGITNRPDELIHLVMDVLARRRG
jgi:CheY-like chemotaxis protein